MFFRDNNAINGVAPRATEVYTRYPAGTAVPRYAAGSRPGGVTHGTTLWVALLISQQVVLLVTPNLSKIRASRTQKQILFGFVETHPKHI